MTEDLKIGDVVKHKAKCDNFNTEMTIHYFLDSTLQLSSPKLVCAEWCVCVWLNRNTLTYDKFTFNINEIEKT